MIIILGEIPRNWIKYMYLECFWYRLPNYPPKACIHLCWFPAANKMACTTQCWPTGHYNVVNLCQSNELKKAISVFCLVFLWLSMRIKDFFFMHVDHLYFFFFMSYFSYTWPVFLSWCLPCYSLEESVT